MNNRTASHTHRALHASRFTLHASHFTFYVSRLASSALILLALFLRLSGLAFQSLWRDEVDAICFAQSPLLARWPATALAFTPSCPPNIPDLLSAFSQPGYNGPLYFLILRGWIGLTGYSEYALRFLSLLCGVISVALIISLGTRLFNRAVGLIAGALLAVSAYQVWYGQEAKMYALITMLALASVYCLRRGVEDGKFRFWAGVVICTSLVMYAHILAALLIPVQIAMFLLWWSHSRKHLLAGALALALVTLPYLPLAIKRAALVFAPAETGFDRYSLAAMINVLGSAYTRGILNAIDERWLVALAGLVAVLAVFGLLAIDTPARSEPRRDRVCVRLSLVAWAAIPLLLIYLISLNRPIFTDRYLIWIQPAVYLAVALGLYAMWKWIKPLGFILLVVLFGVNAVGVWTQATTAYKSDFRAAAQTIGQEMKPDGVLIFQIPYTRYTFDYYFRRVYPWLEGPYTNFPGAFDGYQQSNQAVFNQLTQQFQGKREVWLVASETEMWDQRDLLRNWLNAHGQITFQAEYPRVQVRRYELTR